MSSEGLCQNLVQNGSFEEFSANCPIYGYTGGNYVNRFYAKNWTIACGGADLFHPSCFTQKYSEKLDPKKLGYYFRQDYLGRLHYGVPENYLGTQLPHHGNTYASFRLYPFYVASYLQNELMAPLIEGQRYYAEFWLSRPENSFQALDNLGVRFEKKFFRYRGDEEKLMVMEPQVINPLGEFIEDTAYWTKISGYFIAEGGEKFMIVGVFLRDNKVYMGTLEASYKAYGKIKTKQMEKENYTAGDNHYYFDDFKLYPVDENGNEIIWQTSDSLTADTVKSVQTESFQPGKAIILPDITFEVNKTELSQAVKPLLDSLALYLQSNPQFQLSVNGHTDNTGSEQANLLLSQNRAKAVQDYLTSKGIKPERISITGYGSSMPVSDNNTEEGRAQNRRVEIIIRDK